MLRDQLPPIHLANICKNHIFIWASRAKFTCPGRLPTGVNFLFHSKFIFPDTALCFEINFPQYISQTFVKTTYLFGLTVLSLPVPADFQQALIFSSTVSSYSRTLPYASRSTSPNTSRKHL